MLAGTVSSKGQVTIPKEIRKMLGVEPSDRVVFTPLGKGKVLITSANRPASDIFGILKHRKLEQPVSIDEMEQAVRERRIGRGEA